MAEQLAFRAVEDAHPRRPGVTREDLIVDNDGKPITLKGRWCGRCNLTGTINRDPEFGFLLTKGDIRSICPDCGGSGFKGLTSTQVRMAELNAHAGVVA